MSAIGLEPATFKMVVSSVIHQATAIQKEIASELAHNIQLQRQVPKNLPDRNSGQGQRGQRLNPLFADNYIIEFLVCYNSHRLFPYRKLMSAIGLEPATFKMVVSSVIHQATAIQKEIASELAHNIQLQRQVPKNLPDRNSGQGQRGQRLNPLFPDNYIIEFLVCYNSHRLFPYRKLMSAIGLEPATFKMVVSSVIHLATEIHKRKSLRNLLTTFNCNVKSQRISPTATRAKDNEVKG